MARNTKDAPEEQPEYDFAADLVINEHALDSECVRQPGLFYKWASLRTDAEFAEKKAHERVKSVRSRIIMDAAQNGINGNSKPTGPVIEAYYRTHPDYVEAKAALINAEHNLSVANDAVAALRMRKDMLESTVRLQLAGYYAAPSTQGAEDEVDVEAGARRRTRNKE